MNKNKLPHPYSYCATPTFLYFVASSIAYQARIQDFKFGGAREKIAPGGARREHFGDISCENSNFRGGRTHWIHTCIWI